MEKQQNYILDELAAISEDMSLYDDTELGKLKARLVNEGAKLINVTLAPGCTATNEEIAAEINRVDEELKDPVNNLIALLSGREFLLRDAAMQRNKIISDTPFFEPIPLTYEQKDKREFAELLGEAISMIKKLRDENIELRDLANS